MGLAPTGQLIEVLVYIQTSSPTGIAWSLPPKPLHDFESLEEARQEIDAFIERYNRGWLLERHGYRTPAQVREEFIRKAA